VQNTVQPAILPILAQSFPAFTPTFANPGPQREAPNWSYFPPSAPIETSTSRPMFVPQVQQRPELENSFAWWFHPRTRLSSWRIREIERQREMDLIAEPYIARLREVSRRKKVEAEARALAGQQKVDRPKKEQEKSWVGNPSTGDEKKLRRELKDIERQQRSGEKRQARKDARERRRRRKSAENTPLEGKEADVPVPPRRKSSGRPKPYSIPHPTTRSPRRLHVMPGGFDSDVQTPDQTSIFPDALWEGLRFAVDIGFRRLWTQS